MGGTTGVSKPIPARRSLSARRSRRKRLSEKEAQKTAAVILHQDFRSLTIAVVPNRIVGK
jgi:hypothetical protein